MDLTFSKEEVAFRDEVRAFFRDNVPSATRQKLQEGRHLGKEEMIEWWRILNKKGWGVSHWPKEYGGTRWRRSPSASAWSARSSTPSATRRRRSTICRASPMSTTGGARAFRSRARA